MKRQWLSLKLRTQALAYQKARLKRFLKVFTQATTDTTRKYGGTGLGLTISKRLVKLLGGTIEVSSKVSEGTIFTVNIPFALSKAKGEKYKQN